MLSIVDAADVAAQGGSALAAAAADATGHGSSSIVVAAASLPSGDGERKRVRSSEFPDMSDTEYREMIMMQRRRARSRRPRAIVAGSVLGAHTQRVEKIKISSSGVTSTALLWLLEAAPAPPQGSIGLEQPLVGASASAGNGSADFCDS